MRLFIPVALSLAVLLATGENPEVTPTTAPSRGPRSVETTTMYDYFRSNEMKHWCSGAIRQLYHAESDGDKALVSKLYVGNENCGPGQEELLINKPFSEKLFMRTGRRYGDDKVICYADPYGIGVSHGPPKFKIVLRDLRTKHHYTITSVTRADPEEVKDIVEWWLYTSPAPWPPQMPN